MYKEKVINTLLQIAGCNRIVQLCGHFTFTHTRTAPTHAHTGEVSGTDLTASSFSFEGYTLRSWYL